MIEHPVGPIRLAGALIRAARRRYTLLYRDTPELQQWETPGGAREDGETDEEATAREIREELGIEVEIGDLLGRYSFISGGVVYDYPLFSARILSGSPRPMEARFTAVQDWSLEEMAARSSEMSPNIRAYLRLIGHLDGGL